MLMSQGVSDPQPRGPLRDELGAAKYRHEAIAAILRVTPGHGLQVMAYRREREPFAGQWALPSGPLEVDENIDQSVRRHVGVPVDFMEQLSTRSDIGRDPFDRTVATTHVGLVAWDKLADVQFVDLEQTWAFDHGDIVSEAVARLRAKVSYTNIAFALCPEEFTMSDLARAYEAVLGYSVGVSNLQRVLMRRGQLELTGNLSRPGKAGGRPAKQFRFVRRQLEVTDPFAAFAPAANSPAVE